MSEDIKIIISKTEYDQIVSNRDAFRKRIQEQKELLHKGAKYVIKINKYEHEVRNIYAEWKNYQTEQITLYSNADEFKEIEKQILEYESIITALEEKIGKHDEECERIKKRYSPYLTWVNEKVLRRMKFGKWESKNYKQYD